MSIDELKFRWHYFWNTFKTWISNGAILCKDPLYWDLWADDERVEWHVGSFWQFIKWIVTHETFDNLQTSGAATQRLLLLRKKEEEALSKLPLVVTDYS